MARLLLLACLAAGATAQVLVETWSYPATTTIPNWSTEFGGDWQVASQELVGDPRAGWHFLLRDGVTATDAAAETIVRYDTPAHLQFGGVCLRTTIRQGVLRCYLAKIQDNTGGGSGAFNRAYLYYYESPFGMVRLAFADVSPSTVVRTRLVVADEGNRARVMGFFDTDLDGVWDLRLTAYDGRLAAQSGKVGVCGFARNRSDDWRYYNAVLYATNPGAGPGQTLELVLKGPAASPYVAGASAGRLGFPFGPVRVPLSPDLLLALTYQLPQLFQNFLGGLDPQGEARLRIAYPNTPALKGVVFYVAAVLFGPRGPVAVTNDVQVRVGG